MPLLSILLGWILSASVSHAEFITLTNGKNEKEGVNISVGASVNFNGSLYNLTTVGSGVRRKKVVVVPIKVYVAQVMVADPTHFDRSSSGAVSSFDRQAAAVMHLSFLRDVPADTIRESFIDGLKANQIDIAGADMTAFLEAVQSAGAAEAGSQYAIFMAKLEDGQEVIAIENKGATTAFADFVGPAGTMKKIVSIWLGASADSYLEELKNELLN